MCKPVQAGSPRFRSWLLRSENGNVFLLLAVLLAGLGGCSSTPNTCLTNPEAVTQVTEGVRELN